MDFIFTVIVLISIISHTLCNTQTNPHWKIPQQSWSLKLSTKPNAHSASFDKPRKEAHNNLRYKELPHSLQQLGSKPRNYLPGNVGYSSTIVTYSTMMSAKTRQGSSALKKIEKFRLINKKKNDKIRKQQEEEEKHRKDEEEAA